MKNERPEVGSHVDYISRNANGANVVRSGIIIGFGSVRDASDADFPPAHIAFIEGTRLSALDGAGWRAAFDRAIDVPHASSKKEDRHLWVTPQDPQVVRNEMFAQLQAEQEAHAESKSELDKLKAIQSAPTSADLDAVAADQKAAEATSGEPAGKIKIVKGSQAKS